MQFEPNSSRISKEIREKGFAIVPRILTTARRDELLQDCQNCIRLQAGIRPSRSGAIRHLFDAIPEAYEIACSGPVAALVKDILGLNAFPVRGILFDKSASVNWAVPWHQDLCIAVRERAEVQGYGPWSVKQGVPHAEAPGSLLSEMLTVRIQLDHCEPDDGELQVMPGSHNHGRLTDRQTDELIARHGDSAAKCHVAAGGAVVMRPLLVHASDTARTAAHRRIMHLEFAAVDLPAPLVWRWPHALAESYRSAVRAACF